MKKINSRANRELQKLVFEIGTLRQESREKNQRLINIEARHKNLVMLSGGGIATFDLKGIVKSVNPSFLRVTGFSKDEILGKHISKLPLMRKVDILKHLKTVNSFR